MQESDVQRAYRVFRATARDIEQAGALTAHQLGAQLRSVSEHVLDLLDESDETRTDPADVMSGLDAKSQDIAEDLRRVGRLMRERQQGDH